MKKALNQNNKLVDIIESIDTEKYICPVCKEELTRNFGIQKQFYSHPKDKDNTNCEIKMKLILKEDRINFEESEMNILSNEFYNKQFDDVKIEMSDYLSEEGYYLTKEQKDIIFSTEDRIKISALAGSAKSSTLYYYAKERPFKKILYLVYNKSMKIEADKSFGKLSHTEVKTIHSLAYSYIGRFYKDKLTFNYGIIDIIKDLNLNWDRDMDLAVKINEMMKQYMLSEVINFSDLDLYKPDREDNKFQTDYKNKIRDNVIMYCEKLFELKKNYKNKIKVEHDFYLKLFQLNKVDLSNKYDIILLDEAQDGNKMMLDIIENSNVKSIVIVGDKFQTLYAWRNATNIMPLFEAKEYNLTTSFRVSQNIAYISNLIVKDISNNDIQMKGFNNKQKIVDKINKDKPYICLCRTNAFIFSEVAQALSKNKKTKLYFEGGYKSYNFENLKDAYWFSIGHSTKNTTLSKFENYNKMESYAKHTEDLELLSLTRMVDNYGSKIIDIVDGIKYNAVENKEEADILFSTIHRAKGQTYSLPIYISGDHFDLENTYRKVYIFEDKEVKLEELYEEMCVVYVAITRAFSDIELSDNIKKYLLLRHQTTH